MLRFVLRAWLAAPADEQEDGNSVDGAVCERHQRVDAVAETGVLEENERGKPRCHLARGGVGDGKPLVGAHGEAVGAECGLRHGSEVREQGVGDARGLLDPSSGEDVEEALRCHSSASLTRARMSWIGAQCSDASKAR